VGGQEELQQQQDRRRQTSMPSAPAAPVYLPSTLIGHRLAANMPYRRVQNTLSR
jgi:hypothetical protein